MWLPQEDTSAIVLTEAPAILSASTEQYPPLGVAFTISDEGETSLLCDLGNGQHLQLTHHDVEPGRMALGAFVPLGIEGFDRLESIQRLLAALHERTVPPETRLTKQQRARLRRMLQSVDGYRNGATQQEIAQVVFRIGPLDRHDWQKSSARHAVKALLRDARAMIAGGYRMLLRHRRQS
ncbi:DUF2285 domain-containing protein [Mesorhizobium sp. B4-1-3]|nr:DUF2285 domain-containing protein [Mesorhizobium sp. B4-1-3]